MKVIAGNVLDSMKGRRKGSRSRIMKPVDRTVSG